MRFNSIMLAGALLATAAAASSAAAATNLIKNGSFEVGSVGVGGFVGWTKTNVPSDSPAIVLAYGNNNGYPTGAYGESIFADNAASHSPDAVGNQAAYFVGDYSRNESISQLTYLGVGNYRVGFSYFLTQNGLNNVGNSSFAGTIIGIPVAVTAINDGSVARTWFYASGVGAITKAGYYSTSFVFNSNLAPSKDIIIDRVFASVTNDPATVIIPPNPTVVPEASTWMMLLAGFGLVGIASRRRGKAVAA